MTCSAVERTAFTLALAFIPAWGQPASQFEVASVRPTDPSRHGLGRMGPQGGPGTADPGRISYVGVNLEDLIVKAFQVERHQLAGAQALNSARLDVTAKLPPGATKETLPVMLQNLLAERWHLNTHREKREVPVYVLLAGKDGIKMQPAAAIESAPDYAGMRAGESGCPEIPGKRLPTSLLMGRGGYCLTGTGQTMAGLVEMLAGQFDRPVIDMTDVAGKYDFSTNFYPPHGTPPEGDNRTPDVFTAMQRLGLRMESRKAPVEVLVIDYADKMPAEN